MTEIQERFFCLTGTAWTGLSAIATFAAVLVALFLPYYQEYKERNNIKALIGKELDGNYARLVMTENYYDQEVGGQKITALDLMIGMTEWIELRTWGEFKYKLALNNPKEYEKYADLNKTLELITSYKKDFDSNMEPRKTRAIREIEKEIKSFISRYKKSQELS